MPWALGGAYKQVRETIERLGREVLLPRAEAADREGLYPREQMLELNRLGIGSITVPTALGGLGLDYTAYAIATETMAKYCASTAMVYVMHLSAVQTVNLCGNEEQKQRLIVPVREEGKIASLAFSEPATGGHFWYCTSQARRNGTDYIINAEKSFVTSAGQADWYILQTRTPDSNAPEDMSYFIVYNDQPGVSAGSWSALGLNGNSSGPMTFKDVHVRRGDLLGNEGDARYWNDNAIDPLFLLGSSACWLGIAQGALDRAIEHARRKEHKDFNKRLTDYQVIRYYISRMAIATEAVRAMLYRVARQLDEYLAAGRPHADLLYDLWALKVLASDTVIQVTDRAVQVCGGSGFKRGPIERAYRDGRAGAVMGPTNEMCQEWVAKTLLGLPLGYWYEDRDPAATVAGPNA